MSIDGKRVRELFLAAVALDSEEDRSRLLDEECRGDEGLRGEVDRLLELDGLEDTFLDRPLPTEAVAELLTTMAVVGVEQVGPYRLIEELGRGGMGVVFRAIRVDGEFEQEVAVKLLSSLVVDERARTGFENERQILARLDHPYIAPLFDGGVADGGIPYYVMQLVRGEPIDRYCDQRRLSIEERLELFLKVCEAVQFAHQQPVIHRDLKPDNILVTEEGTPRLLDFGIATLLRDKADGEGTELEARWELTPEYASPEQLRGEGVTTASDVYSLGIILHQLLVGCIPHSIEGGSREALAETLAGRGPIRPSERLREERAREIAEGRRSNARQLRRQITGDLDAVVSKSLCAEAVERYQSVAELAEDVRRFLAGHPVEARPLSVVGRAAKLVGRNRLPSALAAGLLVAVLGAAGLLAVQNAKIRQERDVAQEVTEFLVGLFEVSDPSEARGRELTAKEVLDRGGERLRSELAERPELKAHLARTIGRVYENLGLLEDATTQLELSLELRRRVYGDEHAETARGLSDLGNVARARGELEEAERLLHKALELRVRLDGSKAVETAVAQNDLALIYLEQDRFEEAEELVRDGLEVLRRKYPEARATIGDLSITLGVVMLELGELSEAETQLRLGREARAGLGEDHPLLVQAENNLGEALRRAGRYEEAQEVLSRVVASRRRVLGDRHPHLANSLTNLALVCYALDDLESAGGYLAEAREIYRSAAGVEHPAYGAIVNNLAAVRFKAGDLEGAEEAFREALALRRSSLGEEHSDTAQALQNLGVVVRARGDVGEAVELLRRALKVRLEIFGPEDERVASTKENLGAALMDRGDTDRAEELFREAVSAYDATLPRVHPAHARVRTRLGKALIGKGRFTEAEGLLRDADEVWSESSAEDPQLRAETRSLLVSCLAEVGKAGEARSMGTELADSLESVTFTDADKEREILSRLIEILGDSEATRSLEALRTRRAALSTS